MFAYLITFNKLLKLYLKFIKLFFTSLVWLTIVPCPYFNPVGKELKVIVLYKHFKYLKHVYL